ncbi:MAG: hypothetical protein R2823_05345 [Acidimicrobiia bacterium]
MARIIMLGGIIGTILMTMWTLRTAKRPTRIRNGFDIAKLVITAGVIVFMGVIVGVQTPLALAVGASMVGLVVGLLQGRNLTVEFRDNKVYAVRTMVGIAVWAAGLVAMQSAGIINRTGVFRVGQGIALFGAFVTLGLIFGRSGPIRVARTGATAKAAAVAAVLIPVVVFGSMLGGSALAQTDSDLCDFTPSDGYWGQSPDGVRFDMQVLGIVSFDPNPQGATAACSNTHQFNWGDYLAVGVYLMPDPATAQAEVARITQEAQGVANEVGTLAGTGAAAVLDPDIVRISFDYAELWITDVGPYLAFAKTDRYGQGAQLEETETVMTERFGEVLSNLGSGPAPPPTTTPGTTQPPDTPGTTSGDSTDGTTTTLDVDAIGQPFPDDDDPLGWLTEGDINTDEGAAAAVAAVAAAVAVGLVTLAEGQQTLADLFDRPPQTPGSGGLVDEYGDPLVPREDGLYPWDDGTTVRWVPEAEAIELIDRARQARARNAAEELARLDRHRVRAEQDWATYTEDFRERMADARARLERERAERAARMARAERLRDVIEDRAGDPVYDRMLDRLERDPAPSDEDFWRMRTVLATTINDEAAIDKLGDAGVVRMTVEGMQEDAAWLAEQVGTAAAGPFGGAIAGWAVRNPEMPVRIAIAWATGGASEVILAPIDVYRTLEAAADQKMADSNRDLTAGEITWEVGKAVFTEYITGKIGRAFGGKAPEDLPRINRLQRTYMPEVGLPPPNLALRKLNPGDVIPPRLLNQAGYTADHLERLADFSRRRNVVVASRTTNPYSLRHLQAGDAIPKPLSVKSKTIGDLDTYLGANPKHRGTVGLFEPKMPDTSNMSDELAEAVASRYSQRLAEFKKAGDIPIGRSAAAESGSSIYREGGRVFDTKTGKPFAGDMDMVYMKDATTGEIITGQRLADLSAEAQDLGLAEHGVEMNAVQDILKAKGLQPGDPGFRRAFDEAMELRNNLEGATVHGGEIVVEMGTGGRLSMGPSQTELMGMY